MPSSPTRAKAARVPKSETLHALDAAIQTQRAALSNEVLMRASIFAALVSATVIGISFLAQATGFSDASALLALVLLPVTLFVGLMTFLRAVEINREDAIAVAKLRGIHHAYALIDPPARELIDGLVGAWGDTEDALGHGGHQRPKNLLRSLTTTSSVIAALNSVLTGALVSVIAARFGVGMEVDVALGAVAALAAAVGQVAYAARVREGPLAASDLERGPSPGATRRVSASRPRPTSRSDA
jgi:hypothetical protein